MGLPEGGGACAPVPPVAFLAGFGSAIFRLCPLFFHSHAPRVIADRFCAGIEAMMS
jgi:hypothetical protein